MKFAKVLCIKSVIVSGRIDQEETCFLESKEYEVGVKKNQLFTIDETKNHHLISSKLEDDDWFQEHFKLLNYFTLDDIGEDMLHKKRLTKMYVDKVNYEEDEELE
jgi:hypothetical protein